jgi:hypothetical protein
MLGGSFCFLEFGFVGFGMLSRVVSQL